MIKTLLVLLFSTVALAAPQPPSNTRAPSRPTIDILVNGGFESLKAGWTASSSPTFTVSSSSPLNGSASGVFTATAGSQTVRSAQYPIPEGLKGAPCAATILYKSSETTNKYRLQAVDGSLVVLGSVEIPSPVSSASSVAIPFKCPSSGTMALQVVSSGSALGVKFDDATLGKNELIQVSQSSLYGGVVWPQSTSCGWSVTGGSFANYGANVSCNYPSGSGIIGNASVPASQIPAIKFASLPPGEYLVIASGSFAGTKGGANADAYFRFSDGTNFSSASGVAGGGSSTRATNSTITGRFVYTTAQSNITIQLQGATNGADSADIFLDPLADLSIMVYRFPAANELAVKSDTVNWRVDLTQDTADLGTATVVTAPLVNAALSSTLVGNSVTVQVPCSGGNTSTGLTCAAGNPEVGVVFNLPAAGSVEACVDLYSTLDIAANSDGTKSYFLAQTNNTDETVLGGTISAGVHRITSYGSASAQASTMSHKICEVLDFTSAGQKTLKVLYSQTVNSGTIVASNATRFHWIVKPVTQNLPAPVLVGGVTSPSTGAESLLRVSLDKASACSSSPCTIISQSGSGVSAITRSGAGIYSVAFNSGSFTGTPVCSATGFDSGSGGRLCYGLAVSSTQFDLGCLDLLMANADAAFDVQCIGPK